MKTKTLSRKEQVAPTDSSTRTPTHEDTPVAFYFMMAALLIAFLGLVGALLFSI